MSATCGLDPGIVGQLVDAFLADHGRIHVGDQQPFLARAGRVDDDVDAFPAFIGSAHHVRIGVGLDVGGVALGRSSRPNARREAAPAPHSSSLSSSRPAAISVAMTNAHASCRPHRRSDRQRQVGAGAEARGSGPGRGDQRRQRANLPRPADPVGGAVGGRSREGRASALRRAAMGPSPAPPPTGRRWPRPRSSDFMRTAGCRSWSAAPGFICAPCSTASPRSRRSTRRSGPRFAATASPRTLPTLTPLDPVAAATLNPGDTTRIARALEVVKSTGRTLAEWQEQREGGIGDEVELQAAGPAAAPRPGSTSAATGASRRWSSKARWPKSRRLLARKLDPDLPVMRAIGVPELGAHLRGELTLEQAIAAGQQATRRYAKRQYTWFAHQPPPDWPRFHDALEGEAIDRALALFGVGGLARRHGRDARRRHRPCPARAASAWRSSAMATRAAPRRSTCMTAGSTSSSAFATDRPATNGSRSDGLATRVADRGRGCGRYRHAAGARRGAGGHLSRGRAAHSRRRGARLQPRARDPLRLHRSSPRPRRLHGRAQGARDRASLALSARARAWSRFTPSSRTPAARPRPSLSPMAARSAAAAPACSPSTFAEECEADLFNEQAVVWGAVPEILIAGLRYAGRGRGQRGSRLYGMRRRT